MNALRFMPLVRVPQSYLVLEVSAVADDQFSAPKQIRCCPPGSPLAGKLLVCGGAAAIGVHIRGSDLAFWSKFYKNTTVLAVDSDQNYIYFCYVGRLHKASYTDYSIVGSVDFTGIRMIDASGDADYVYVTCNPTGHHAVKKIAKATMTESASTEGADIPGTAGFLNPTGVLKAGNYVYVADGNGRIVELNASDLSYHAIVYLNSNIYDLCTDGTKWYVARSNRIHKLNADWSEDITTGVSAFYSIAYVPDQGDGNGQTLAITDSTNSHLARYKCSDLTQVGSDVGSSGDGTASLFDPAITCVGGGTWYTDDGRSYYAASGAAPSQNGFTGIFWPSAGPHRAIFRPAVGGLAAVTGIDVSNDLVTNLKNVEKTHCAFFTLYSPASGYTPVTNFPYTLTTISISYWPKGSIAFAKIPNCTTIELYAAARGSLSEVNRSATSLYAGDTVASLLVSGTLADLPTTLAYCQLQFQTTVTPASIAASTAIRDIRIYSMGWTAQQNTDVLASAYNARMSYTYASGIQLRISAPTGTVGTEPPGDGESNTDWNWNAGTGKHEPLTGYAYIFMLGNDIYSEGYKTWSVTIV